MKKFKCLIVFIFFLLMASHSYALTVKIMGGEAGTPADQILRPASDYNVNWTPVPITNRYANVDEVSADGDSTYIYRNYPASYQGFDNFPSLPSGTILGVSICVTARFSVGNGGIDTRLYVNGTSYSVSAGTGIGSSYAEYCHEWTTNPDTSSTWVKEDVEGTGANAIDSWGIIPNGLDSGETTRATQVYMTVRYNP